MNVKFDEETVDVVAVGAHPDDVELGIGGTLAKLAKSGIRTGIIDLTNAEPTPSNEKYRSPDDFDPDYALKRLTEAQKANLLEDNPNPVIRFKAPLDGKTSFNDRLYGKIEVDNSTLQDFVSIDHTNKRVQLLEIHNDQVGL